MPQMDSLDFAEYVNKNRQNLQDGLNNRNLQFTNRSLEGLVSSAIMNLKEPEPTPVPEILDYTPDPELEYLKNFHKTDQLLKENNPDAEYDAAVYYLVSKEDLGTTTFSIYGYDYYINGVKVSGYNNQISSSLALLK